MASITERDDGSRRAIAELLHDYERSGDPWRFKAGGFCIWPIFRHRIALRLMAHASDDSFADPSSEAMPTVRAAAIELLKTLPWELSGLARAARRRTQLLGKTGPGWRRDVIDKRGMDASFDFMEEALLGFTLSEACSSRQRGNPYPSVYNEYAFPVRALLSPLKKRQGTLCETLMIENLESHLKRSPYAEAYGLPGNLTRRGLVTRFLGDAAFWFMLFKFLKPKAFIVVCSYGQEAPIAGAIRAGVPVWELQHGTIGEYHFGYSYGASARAHTGELPLPERILTFGPYFSEILSGFGFWDREQLPALGFPRLAFYKGRAVSRPPEQGRFNIMMSTQWTLEDEYYDFARTLAGILPFEARLVINPHPRSSPGATERLASLAGGRVEVMDRSGSLYARMAEVDLHCSVYSTTLFESVGLGIPTVVLQETGWSNVRSLLDTGAARAAADPASLAALVKRALGDASFLDGWRARTARAGEYYFEPFDISRATRLLQPP